MKGAFNILNIRGIKLFIHWTFLLLLVWVVLANVQSSNNIGQIAWSVLFTFAVFACVVLHELGHALMAARFGIKAKNIVLLPIGGVASIEKFPDNPRQELAISIAGPVVNLAIAGVLWLFLPQHTSFWEIPKDTSITHGHDFLFYLRAVNIGLAAFNLIPAFPMDGGRVLRAIIGLKLNYIRATAIAATIGKVIAAIFIGLGILVLNPFLPLIGVFIIFSASTEEYYLRLKSLVKDIKLKEALMFDYNSLQADMTVQEAAGVLINNHSKYFVLMEEGKPTGSINRLEIVKAISEMKYNEKLRNLAKEDIMCLDGEEQIGTVLETLASDDERIFPVMDKGQFSGVVNFNHIIEYLLLHKAVTREYGRMKSLIGLLH